MPVVFGIRLRPGTDAEAGLLGTGAGAGAGAEGTFDLSSRYSDLDDMVSSK